MRADRLLATVLLLQARGRLTAPELAERLEVSVRTVYRDLDALSAAGVPVYATTGRNGGVTLPPGYRPDLTALRPAEARALFLGGAPGPLTELGVGDVLEGALRKLSAALPATARGEAERARQRLLVDSTDFWQGPAEPPPHLRTVEGAVWGDQRLRISYARYGRAPSERVIDPYALVAKQGVWYLVAAVAPEGAGVPAQGAGEAGRGERRGRGRQRGAAGAAREPVVFRVSRIAAATVLDEPGQRPPDFDLAAFWTAWCAAFLASVPRYPTTLRATPAAARLLGRRFGRGVPPPPPGEPDADGRVTLEIDLETLEVACNSVLGVGPEAEVLAPPELRAEVIARLAAASARYAPPGAPPAAGTAPGGGERPAPLP